MPCPARYDGCLADSERLKVALGKESNWALSWNELRFRQAGYPPPFSGTFAEGRGTSQTSSQTSFSRRRSLLNGEGVRLDEFLVPRSPSLASSFASGLKTSQSLNTLNPIHGSTDDGENEYPHGPRTWQVRHATAPVYHAHALRPRATPRTRSGVVFVQLRQPTLCSPAPCPPLSATCAAQTSYRELFKAPAMSEYSESCSSLASRIPDDATLDALLLRRSRARGRGGGASTRLVDKVESKWTLLYGR